MSEEYELELRRLADAMERSENPADILTASILFAVLGADGMWKLDVLCRLTGAFSYQELAGKKGE